MERHRDFGVFALGLFFLVASSGQAEQRGQGAAVTEVEVSDPAIVERASPQPGTQTAAPIRAARPRRAPSPMALEMNTLLEDERVALRDLQARYRSAADPATALDAQRRIEQLKVNTEIGLLRIQASWARREGRAEQASHLEKAIEEILHPQPPLTTVKRPLPADDARRTAAPAGR
jgi:hypothetical protein